MANNTEWCNAKITQSGKITRHLVQEEKLQDTLQGQRVACLLQCQCGFCQFLLNYFISLLGCLHLHAFSWFHLLSCTQFFQIGSSNLVTFTWLHSHGYIHLVVLT